MSRDNWKELPAAEWKRRLAKVRAIAVQRLAWVGLDVDGVEDNLSSLLVYGGGVGQLLKPDLAGETKHLDALVRSGRGARRGRQGWAERFSDVCTRSPSRRRHSSLA